MTLVMTNEWLYIMCICRFINFSEFAMTSTISHVLFFLCSEEELPYHNAAMERVRPAVYLLVVTGELCLSDEENLLPF